MGHVMTLKEAGLINPDTEVLDLFTEWGSTCMFLQAILMSFYFAKEYTYNLLYITHEKDDKMTAFRCGTQFIRKGSRTSKAASCWTPTNNNIRYTLRLCASWQPGRKSPNSMLTHVCRPSPAFS